VLVAEGIVPPAPAYNLLSSAALRELVLAQPSLVRGADAEDEDFLLAFDRRLGSPDPERSAAEEVAETYAGRIAALVTTLKTGPTAARAGRPEWDHSYWDLWSSVQRLTLGGGLLSGNLGRYVAERLPSLVAGIDLEVRVSEFARSLPLIGAARSVASPGSKAVVLDFGQTSIKRAVAVFSGNRLKRLNLLEPLPAFGTTTELQELGDLVVEAIALTWLEARGRGDEAISQEVTCSVACYLKEGHPFLGSTGAYANLRELSYNLACWLSKEVSGRLKREIAVQLLHDGTAAGRGYPATSFTPVIMFGTALGVGFSSSQSGLLEVSPGFSVASAKGA
jgi:hypothetical protein